MAWLDQMFTAENFRKVFDLENRKGRDLAHRFYPHLDVQTQAIKEKAHEVRLLRKRRNSLSAEEFKREFETLNANLKSLKSKKSSDIDAEMESISADVNKSNFKITLEKRTGPKGKPVYCIDPSPQTYFVIKQLQRNLNSIYDVMQSNRHDLACQVRDTLDSSFPYEFVRTDITAFYESIDRKRLFEKLDRDQLLSPSSKKFVKQVLDAYGEITGEPKGIPRGVGISAYLAEFYLRPVDAEIRSLKGNILYCRYVDDIVAVFARPPIGETLPSYKDAIVDVFSKHGLSHNAAKTAEFKVADGGVINFEYLGFRFNKQSNTLKIFPSANKIAKYRKRLEASFAAYTKASTHQSKRSYRQLAARVMFLTGNTRLSNSKSSAFTGLFYNNSLVTELDDFKALDLQLKSLVKSVRRAKLRNRLKGLTYVSGFTQRRFHKFSPATLQTIVKVWRHG